MVFNQKKKNESVHTVCQAMINTTDLGFKGISLYSYCHLSLQEDDAACNSVYHL